MAPSSANGADSTLLPTVDNSENNLQPFYVLHKLSSRKSERNSKAIRKTRRKIELSPSKSNGAEKKLEAEGRDDSCFERMRLEAFELVWSKTETIIKSILKEINTNIFDEIYHWIRESFDAIPSSGTPGFGEASRSFPTLADANSKRLFTGLVLTKNMEFADDLLTFEELGLHLKSCGCHVARLSALDISAKNGIGGCLRILLRQFLMVTHEAAEMSILASWYREQGTNNNPVVLIIEDMERCCGSVLSNFILMLSEWALKIPIILVMGVSTTLDAPRNILSTSALQQLCSYKFMLGSPAERMEAVVVAVLLRHSSVLSIGHKVAVFLKNYFLNQDGTLTSFIRGLKIACVQHFCSEPLSFMLGGLLVEDDSKDENPTFLSDMVHKYALETLFYSSRYQMDEGNGSNLARSVSELKRLQKIWRAVVMCLYEAGKPSKIPLLDILCEALDPDLYMTNASHNQTGLGKGLEISSSDYVGQNCFIPQEEGSLCQVVRKIRDLPAAFLSQLLISWENFTINVPELHDKVRELQSSSVIEDKRCLRQHLPDTSKRHALQSQLCTQDPQSMNEKVAILVNLMVREHLTPIECIPLHEIFCFKDVEKLKLALIGDPRRRIQADLLDFHKILKCSCCSRSGNTLSPSMHDSSIMYILAQEHGDLINLHDWFQSFKAIVLQSSTKRRKSNKQSPLPKKRKDMNESEDKSEASVQARFCRSVTELQITGLLRMRSKRRPDYVQRIAFGL